jgi:predicted phosphoribosyltransferase
VEYHVARWLRADFSIIITRKLPFPHNPESGFGAIAEDGSMFTHPLADEWVSESEQKRVIQEQKKEIERRKQKLRKKELPKIKGRTIIVVDDGIAMGSTMRASIAMVKNRKAAHIVVAVPVAGRQRVQDMKELVDDIIVLATPRFFRAVARVYENWYDVPDKEVCAIMEKWDKEHY